MFSLEASKVTIRTILRTMDNNSIEMDSGTIRTAYSGRGMFGSTCLGIVLDGYDMETFVDEIKDAINDEISGHSEKDGDVIDMLKALKEGIRHPSRDSMGRSVIHYYTNIVIPNEHRAVLEQLCLDYINEC